MDFWNKITGFLFPSKEAPPSFEARAIPLSSGLLKRSPEETDAFRVWKTSPSKRGILEYIAQNYQVWKQKPCEQCECIDFHQATAFRGFVVHFGELEWSSDEVRHLMDYIKESVVGDGYRVDLSSFEEIQKRHWVERHEKHYLKPRLEYEGERRIQRYGNVSVEAIFRDGDPIQLRFSACYYNDRQFTAPLTFCGLMKNITA